MALPAGARFGPYEVLSPLGAGGMGEVYRARDTRLNRTVAVKLLPAELRDRPDRRQRFDLEARAISSLQHPHICALFDVGEQDGTAFLVMEHLEGETLEDRLTRGALPARDVLLYAAQIADALDHAHRANIVHRDLKPSNVMLTSSGAKLLDFGLARNPPVEVTSSTPTVTVPPDRLTSEGTILGTFQYMAPEQLEGKNVDARTDVFALGALIYEMATGRKAFEGTSQASLIAAILTGEPPPISATASGVSLPAAVDHVVARCLAKRPDDRWQTARDVRLELAWIAGESPERPPAAVIRRRPRLREALAWALAAIALVLAGTTLAMRRGASPAALTRFVVSLPAGTTVGLGREFTTLAASPDGRQLAFVAVTDGRQQLWVQSFEETAPRLLEGTEGGVSPFWSPDSRFVGFVSRKEGLKKIDPSGGPARLICVADATGLPVWNRDNTILFSESRKGISRVSADGGAITSVTQVNVEARELNHYWPSMLPDGRHFLYTATSLGANGQRATPTIYVASLDPSEPRREIVREHSRMVYAGGGYVLYVQEATLFARALDLSTYRLTGEPVRVTQGLDYYRSTGLSGFSVSDNGVLAHHSGVAPIELVWFDRAGNRVGTLGEPRRVSNLRISPDGQQVMVEVLEPRLGTSDLYLHETARGTSRRFTSDPNDEMSPVWSWDGRTILFRSDRGTGADAAPDFFTKGLDGADEVVAFVKRGTQANEDWSRTGLVAYTEPSGKVGRDIWLLSMAENNKTWPFVSSPREDAEPRFSPDSAWIAYASDETGSFEIYVKPLREGGKIHTVSRGGGMSPRWRRDGTELFYLSGDGTEVLRVATEFGATLKVGLPAPLFRIGASTSFRTVGGNRVYDVTPDGQRFLIGVSPADSATSRITVVLNWTALLPH